MTDTPRIILHNDKTEGLVEQLLARFPDADYRTCDSYEALPSLIDSYRPDIVYSIRFAGTAGFPRDALFGANGPRWLANGGAGTDHFGQWDAGTTTVTNAAGVAADMMAEYVFGGFLHFTLDVPGLQKDKAAKVWNGRTVAPLFGKTLVVVGLGHTGQAIALRAKAFGMHVLGTRAICTPLTPATRGIIGADEIASMKSGVVLADVSRGGVVAQSALLDGLTRHHIAGAALDVFETEPLPTSSPFWDLDNVIISPHCSSVHADWEAASFELFLKNLTHWVKHEDLINVVDPARGY